MVACPPPEGADLATRLIDGPICLGQLFSTVAQVNPISAILLAIGDLLVLFSLGFFAYLVVGAIASSLVRSPPSSPRPPENR